MQKNYTNLANLILQTERLILRPLQMTDLDDLYEYDSDTENTKYMYALSVKQGEVLPKEQCVWYLEQVCDQWKKQSQNQTLYEFAVVLKESQKMIGNMCLNLCQDTTQAEIGWVLNRKFHKQGFAYEAAKELLHFGFTTLGLKKVIAHCDELNIASSSLMKKLGFTLHSSGNYRKYPNTQEESTEAEYWLFKTQNP